jgi:undecaprenyl-diphosphatase
MSRYGLLILSLIIFALLAYSVSQAWLYDIDTLLIQTLQTTLSFPETERSSNPFWFNIAMQDMTRLGSIAVIVLICSVVTCFLLIRRQVREAIFLLSGSIGGFIGAFILKSLFSRPRPNQDMALTEVYTSSFPSAHAMMAITAFGAMGYLLAQACTGKKEKTYILITAFLVIFIVGFSRVYLGVHYPSDILAGWAAGLSWLTLCSFILIDKKEPISV